MGGLARELLRNAEYLDHKALPRPLLTRRELLALDLEILARNDTAAIHELAAEAVEP